MFHRNFGKFQKFVNDDAVFVKRIVFLLFGLSFVLILRILVWMEFVILNKEGNLKVRVRVLLSLEYCIEIFPFEKYFPFFL